MSLSNSPRTSGASRERLQRACYRAWVACGLRAFTNRVHGWMLGGSLERKLGFALVPHALEGWKLRIDARARPQCAPIDPDAQFGMLSAHRTDPPIARWAYRYLLARSHFGVGHVELAFYCSQQTVYLYALRNVAQGTARRWHWNRHVAALGPSEGQALWIFVETLAQCWSDRGLRVRLCHPEVCLNLAVDPRWIPPAKRPEVRARLLARYQQYARCAARQEGAGIPLVSKRPRLRGDHWLALGNPPEPSRMRGQAQMPSETDSRLQSCLLSDSASSQRE